MGSPQPQRQWLPRWMGAWMGALYALSSGVPTELAGSTHFSISPKKMVSANVFPDSSQVKVRNLAVKLGQYPNAAVWTLGYPPAETMQRLWSVLKFDQETQGSRRETLGTDCP